MVTILLVEDEEILQQLMVHTLSGEGYEIIEASDGEAGLKLAEEHLPNLIISDMSMPKMTGWDLAKKLRTNPPAGVFSTKSLRVFSTMRQHRCQSRSTIWKKNILGLGAEGISGAQNDEIQGMECFQGVVELSSTATMKTRFHNAVGRPFSPRETSQ